MSPHQSSARDFFRLAHQIAKIEEARIRTLTTHEEAILIDHQTGAVVWRKIGYAGSVEFTDAEVAQMRDHILTHNHPGCWGFPADDPRRAGNSFSPADIALMVDGQLAEIRVVSARYLHTLRPPASTNQSAQAIYFRRQIATMPYAEVRYQIMQYVGHVRARLRARIISPDNPMTIAEAEANLWHEVIEMMVNSWGVEYERKEWLHEH